MTFTYTAGSSTNLNRARRALNDTRAPVRFSDEEIEDWISDRGCWEGAVAEGYRALAGKVAAEAQDYSNASGSVNQTANHALLMAQADAWDKRAAAATSADGANQIPKAIIRQLGTSPSDPYDTRS